MQKTGKVIWFRDIVKEEGVKLRDSAGSLVPPLCWVTKWFLNSSPGGMALDARTGKTLWKSGNGPGAYATPGAVSNRAEDPSRDPLLPGS